MEKWRRHINFAKDMNADELREEMHTRFADFIRRKGMRQTQERFVILDKVLESRTHFDIDDLYKDVESEYHVSKATVYNTVDLLCEAGIVRKHFLNGQQAAYEISTDSHVHLICTVCGKVREERENIPETPRELQRFKGFTPSYTVLNVYGICSSCLAKQRREERERNKNKT